MFLLANRKVWGFRQSVPVSRSLVTLWNVRRTVQAGTCFYLSMTQRRTSLSVHREVTLRQVQHEMESIAVDTQVINPPEIDARGIPQTL